ncbi:MAG: TSUP family transporter [Bacteroidia bacterium]
MDIQTVLILLLTGLIAGFASGMVGIGGGILIIPALIFFLGLTQHQAQGATLGLLLMPVGFLAAINYYKTGNLNIYYSLIMALTFVGGAWLGSKVSLSIDAVLMRKIFGGIIFLISLKLIFSK